MELQGIRTTAFFYSSALMMKKASETKVSVFQSDGFSDCFSVRNYILKIKTRQPVRKNRFRVFKWSYTIEKTVLVMVLWGAALLEPDF